MEHRYVALLFATACTHGTAPPREPAASVVIPAPLAPTRLAPRVDATPAAWPATVDTSLGAPDGFHLLARSKDATRVLVEVTTTITFMDKHQGGPTRSNGEYLAEIEIEHGCMKATYDFPALSAASATGTKAEALAVLSSPAMATDIARARAIASAYGPNETPIRVSADGRHVVLEANNTVYWAADGRPFSQVGQRAAVNPTLSEAGRYVLFGYGGGSYLPTVLDLQTKKLQAVTRAKGKAMTQKDLFPLADGTFLVAEEPDDSHAPHPASALSKVCLSTIDVEHARETEMVCIPSRILSSSVGEISMDGRYAMLHAEGPDRVVVWDTRTWRPVTDVSGAPIYAKLDGQGRVAWEGLDGVLHIAHGDRVDPLPLKQQPNGLYPTLAGYLDGRLLLGHPAMKSFAFEGPLKSLRDASPCGWLSVGDPP